MEVPKVIPVEQLVISDAAKEFKLIPNYSGLARTVETFEIYDYEDFVKQDVFYLEIDNGRTVEYMTLDVEAAQKLADTIYQQINFYKENLQ